MITKTGTVRNENGIHCRPATQITKKVKGYGGVVRITNSTGMEASANSILAILRLGLIVGDSVTVSVEGPDEEKMCDEIMEMLENPFEYA